MKPERSLYLSWGIAGCLPGLLAGALLAGLLFFLNPELAFTPAAVARAVLFLSIGGALGSALIHAPLAGAGWLVPWRLLPWTVTAVLACAALLNWIYASRLSFYLPPGIDGRLIGAAIWLSLLTLTSFYTALLHSLQDRPYSFRSRSLIFICAALAVLTTLERRGSYRPPLPPSPRSSISQSPRPPRLLVVGIDGASLDAVLPLAEQGRLPFLANLLNQGAYGRLATFSPVESLPLWFSVATGQYPFRHGLVSDSTWRAPFLASEQGLALIPQGLGLPYWGRLVGITRDDRQAEPLAPALWEILGRTGAQTAVVAWPTSEPSLIGADVSVSHTFLSERGATPYEGPSTFLRRVLQRRVSPQSVDPALLARFGDATDEGLQRALAQDLWRAAIVRDLLTTTPTSVVFVHFSGLSDIARRYFGGYMGVQFEGMQGDPDLDHAAQMVTAYYAHLDEVLASLWQDLEAPRLLVLVSAWGTDESGLAGNLLGLLRGRRRALEGRFDTAPDGVLMMQGENLSSGTFLGRVNLLDVAPTLLYGLGMPVARDLDGTILTQGFSATFLNRTPLTFVPAYPVD